MMSRRGNFSRIVGTSLYLHHLVERHDMGRSVISEQVYSFAKRVYADVRSGGDIEIARDFSKAIQRRNYSEAIRIGRRVEVR